MAELIKDGNDNFLGGQDASKDPDKIAPNAYHSGINVTTENGCLSPRWGIEQQLLDFSLAGNYTLPNLQERSYENIFETGKFQALIPYSVGSTYYLIYIVSGVSYLINQETLETSVLRISDGSYIGEDADRINWSPASRYLVNFDYPAYPVIYEGLFSRRANPLLDEIPVSDNGLYNQNRLFISTGNEFTAGDPIGIGFPNAPITFTEILQPSTGFTDQSFQLSTNYSNDPITAMAFLQAVDSSTGIGPMLVSTQNGIWSYQTQLPRTDWAEGQFGQSFVYNNGIIGPQALTNVNSDIFYMSGDIQVRSASMSRDEQRTWSKVPMSREVQNWLATNNKSYAKLSQLCYFNNKIFVTVNPFLTDATSRNGNPVYDIAFGGFAVIETANISNLSQKSNPVWAGLWTGAYPMQAVINNDTVFFAAKQNGKNVLFKMTPGKTVDVIDGKERLIRSRVYTKMYDFQSSRLDKNIVNLELELNHVKGQFDLDVNYRSSVSTSFIDYRTFSHFAPYQTCDVPTKEQLNGFEGHSFKNLNLGNPDENGCNPVTEDNYVNFRKIQYMMTLTGRYWEINQLTLSAMAAPQSQQINSCSGFKPVEVMKQCLDDWKIPESITCP